LKIASSELSHLRTYTTSHSPTTLPITIAFVVAILLAIFLLPLPTPARPTTLMLAVHQIALTRIDADLIFGMAFSSALLFAVLGSVAWLATGRTITQLFEGLHWVASALIVFVQRLSDLSFSSLAEWTAAIFLNAAGADRANAPRQRGPSLPVASASQGRVQRGRRG